MRVGLTGGIGSGKSAVACLFAGWGAVIIDADLLAREVVAPGTPGFAQIAAAWPAVITPEGSLDRAALSRIVFADASALEQLNAIVHPLVRAAAALREASVAPDAIVVHVVPLLFEGDYWKSCAINILVVARSELRVERVVARDGLSSQDVRARMATQIDPARALSMADFVVNNDGDLATLQAHSCAVYAAIRDRSVG